eukprot:Pgem_evm1s8783
MSNVLPDENNALYKTLEIELSKDDSESIPTYYNYKPNKNKINIIVNNQQQRPNNAVTATPTIDTTNINYKIEITNDNSKINTSGQTTTTATTKKCCSCSCSNKQFQDNDYDEVDGTLKKSVTTPILYDDISSLRQEYTEDTEKENKKQGLESIRRAKSSPDIHCPINFKSFKVMKAIMDENEVTSFRAKPNIPLPKEPVLLLQASEIKRASSSPLFRNRPTPSIPLPLKPRERTSPRIGVNKSNADFEEGMYYSSASIFDGNVNFGSVKTFIQNYNEDDYDNGFEFDPDNNNNNDEVDDDEGLYCEIREENVFNTSLLDNNVKYITTMPSHTLAVIRRFSEDTKLNEVGTFEFDNSFKANNDKAYDCNETHIDAPVVAASSSSSASAYGNGYGHSCGTPNNNGASPHSNKITRSSIIKRVPSTLRSSILFGSNDRNNSVPSRNNSLPNVGNNALPRRWTLKPLDDKTQMNVEIRTI